MAVTYEIEEIRSPDGTSRFAVVVKTPSYTQIIGAADSRLPPSYTPGFWSIAEAQRFIAGDKVRRGVAHSE